MATSIFRFICYSDTTAWKTNGKMQSGILKSIEYVRWTVLAWKGMLHVLERKLMHRFFHVA